MNVPPLAIVQARLKSTRLPNKMLLPLAGEPLVWHAWSRAVLAFGPEHVVVACPADDAQTFGEVLPEARIFPYAGDEQDVLSRFYACAHTYRWHPDSVIVRVTPDDPFKSVSDLRRCAAGERVPVEWGGEAFTLHQLDRAHFRNRNEAFCREHITHALFGVPAPQVPEGVWTIDTEADYEAAKRKVGDV